VDLSLYESTYQVEDTHWWFVGRRAVVFDELRRVIGQRENGHRSMSRPRILDLGCGTGRNLAELKQLGDAVGLDLEARALEFCRLRGLASVAQARAEHLPFRNASFEVVTALDLLEHLDDDVAGAREIFRVLQPGGHFLAFVPAYHWLWGPQDDVSHHRRRYTPRMIASTLRRAGFRVHRLTHANLFLLPAILAGRRYLRAMNRRVDSENALHPGWSNGMLREIFSAERHVLRWTDLPMGVSILCVASKDRVAVEEDASPRPLASVAVRG
jgi:SAM-dependent methyltransferase